MASFFLLNFDLEKLWFNCTFDYLNKNGIKKLRLFKKGTILLPKSGASTFLNIE